MPEKSTGVNKINRGLTAKICSAANRDFTLIDYIVIAVLFTICFFSFVQGDIMLTGNRSFLMHTHPLSFYDESLAWTNDYGANYLPSTFILFAIWNLPLRLFGRVPSDVMTNAALNNLWYKLLPVILFFISAWLIYKIACLVGFGNKKAKIVGLAFLISPIAVFSQMIFSQYDIFTVFFILLGTYYYFKKKEYRFILFFGIAITFKYQALIYFMVFLLLAEKRIFRIFRNLVFVAIPFVLELLIYLPSEAFKQSVFGFGALSYLETGINFGGLGLISPFLAVILGLLVAAYVVKIDTDSPLLFKWCMFLANGVSFAFFGFAVFHPQWLMITVPFLVMSILSNKNSKFMLLLQNIYIVALYIMTANIWTGNADQQMFLYSPLKVFGTPNWAVRMKDIYMYDNLDYLFTCVWVILFVYFILSYPKFTQKDIQTIEPDTKVNIRIPFVVGVLAWAVPAFICLFSSIQGKFLMVNELPSDNLDSVAVADNNQISQPFYNSADDIYRMELYFSDYGRINQSDITVQLQELDTGNVVYTREISADEISGNTVWYQVLEKTVELKKNSYYNIVISSDADGNNCVALYDNPMEASDVSSTPSMAVNGQETESSLAMKIYGHSN